ncbi:hypothetical protein [Geobacter sp.]|uniref:hypothetical protein n=1 Tax=Geobacter sp. TaxID=46610 RepID=UPI00261FD7D8|nr:hypothetical protein [Geobacter sp.]
MVTNREGPFVYYRLSDPASLDILSDHAQQGASQEALYEEPRKTMPHEYFWGGGMWIFPTIAIIFGFTVALLMIFLIFGSRGFRPPWHDSGSTAATGRSRPSIS